jgi:hypothetical protein
VGILFFYAKNYSKKHPGCNGFSMVLLSGSGLSFFTDSKDLFTVVRDLFTVVRDLFTVERLSTVVRNLSTVE